MPCAITTVSSPTIFTSSPRNLSPIVCNSTTSPPSPPSSLSSPLALNHIQNSGEEGNSISPLKVAKVMKRKRPAMIDIPVANLGSEDVKKMTLDSYRSREVEFEGDNCSVYCKKGKRCGVMEDRYIAVLGLSEDSKQAFFGVLDGHGGAGAAEFASNNLEKNIMIEVLKGGEKDIINALREGYLNTDIEFMKKDIGGGTCCVTVLIHKGHIFVSNVGDCRAVMSQGGIEEALTLDHKPSLKDEKDRIKSLGGYVDCCHGVWRVHGSLAVSRAIGDRHLKQWVIAEPTTKVLKIMPDSEFLILASDGLWDCVIMKL
ncbi:hypothetical protein RD792_013781, partial [Penstemon davidsonii]